MTAEKQAKTYHLCFRYVHICAGLMVVLVITIFPLVTVMRGPIIAALTYIVMAVGILFFIIKTPQPAESIIATAFEVDKILNRQYSPAQLVVIRFKDNCPVEYAPWHANQDCFEDTDFTPLASAPDEIYLAYNRTNKLVFDSRTHH